MTPRLRVIRTDHSATFQLFHRAILDRKQVICTYNDARREVCPHILGHSGGVEKALVFQFAGESTTKLPPGGEWRCFELSEIRNAEVREGRWHTGRGHRTAQSCVEQVYVDVNTAVPDQPGRR